MVWGLQQAATASTHMLLCPCSGCLCGILGQGRQWGDCCVPGRCIYKLAAGEQQLAMVDRQYCYASCWQAVYMGTVFGELCQSNCSQWLPHDNKLNAVLSLGCRSALPSQQMGSCKCGSQTQLTFRKHASIRCVMDQPVLCPAPIVRKSNMR
jgi:hypothetical protein